MKYILKIRIPGRSVAETHPILYELLSDIPIIKFKISSWPAARPSGTSPNYKMTSHSVLVDITKEDLLALKLRIPDLIAYPDMSS